MNRVSTNAVDLEGDSDSYSPSVSSNGRYIVFSSNAANLVKDDTNNKSDVFVKDMQTGFVERVSVTASSLQADEDSFASAISDDGRYVAFQSYASNLVKDDTNKVSDTFLKDRQTGSVKRVSTSSGGLQANNVSFSPAISSSGHLVAFSSPATNLVKDNTNGQIDTFVKDIRTEKTKRVSVGTSGLEADNHSFSPAISSDER